MGMSAALLLSEATTDWSNSCTRGRSNSYVYPNLIDIWILFAYNIFLDIVTEVVKCGKSEVFINVPRHDFQKQRSIGMEQYATILLLIFVKGG